MNPRVYYIIPFTLFFFLAVGACREAEENEIEIRILSPKNGEPIQDARAAFIHVLVDATHRNEKVKIKVYPINEPDNLLLQFKSSPKAKRLNYQKHIYLASFQKGTEFVLDVEACGDNDCEERARGKSDFYLQ